MAGSEVASALIVGCGSIGTRHAKNLAASDLDLSVFDVDESQQKALAREVGAATPASLDEALDRGPDITLVTTPSNHHIEPAVRAGRAGSHLFVEKPLSADAEGVRELLDVAADRDLVTMIGSNFRFHPGIKAIRKLVNEGAIGPVVSARIEAGSYLPEWHPDDDYRQMYSAKAGVGGALLDYIHELNYARWMFGEVESVSAMLSEKSSLEIDTEDTAALLTRYENGVICQFHLDYVQRAYSRSCHVIGETGTIRWEWDSPVVRRYDADTESWFETARWDPDRDVNRMYVDELDHFVRCVETGTETRSPLEEGWADLRHAIAAKRAAGTGERVSPSSIRPQ